jgi:hypothetical protein
LSDFTPGIPAGWYQNNSGRLQWWDGTQWTENFAPMPTTSYPPYSPGYSQPYGPDLYAPGRIPGFVLAVIAMVFFAVPIIGMPCGIIGLVQSRRARSVVHAGDPGWGLIAWGFTLSVIAICLTSLYFLWSIRNF